MKRMIALFGFLMLIASGSVLAVEVQIRCTNLNGNGRCGIQNGSAEFLTINGCSVRMYETPNCEKMQCDWLGQLSSSCLKEGENQFNFVVASVTTNQQIDILRDYDFYFAGNHKYQFRSKRTGSNLDTVSTTIPLDLSEIDPALYQEWLALRGDFDSFLSGAGSPRKSWEKMRKESRELTERIRKLEKDLNTVLAQDYEQMDPSMLERLGVLESELKLLNSRKFELEEFQKQIEKDQSNLNQLLQTRLASITVRASAYDAELPKMPTVPTTAGGPADRVSSMVQEMRNEISLIVRDFELSVQQEDLDRFQRAIRDWKRIADLVTGMMDQSGTLNGLESDLLYRELTAGFKVVYRDGLTSDGWSRKNPMRSPVRAFLDQQVRQGNVAAIRIKKSVNFRKIPDSIRNEVLTSLDEAQALSEKIDRFQPRTDQQRYSKKVAEAALSAGLEKVDEAIQRESKSDVQAARDSFSIGTLVLDVGLDLIPVVGGAKAAYELFSGKNLVTGEPLTAVELSMSAMTMFANLTGLNLAKLVWESASEAILRIGGKLGLSWFSSKAAMNESLDQLENLIAHHQRNKVKIHHLADVDLVNEILAVRYNRCKKPAFGGSVVIQRSSQKGERLCRVYRKLADGKDTFVASDGGFFFFRCADVDQKSLSQLVEMGAIPFNKSEGDLFFMAEVLAPSNITVFEGVVREMGDKKGGAIQVFFDLLDEKVINLIRSQMVSYPIQ